MNEDRVPEGQPTEWDGQATQSPSPDAAPSSPDLKEVLTRAAQFSEDERLEFLYADQRARWNGPNPLSAHEYLRLCSQMMANPEVAAALIYHEFLIREELGHSPDFADYLAEYAAYAEVLRRLHDADRLIDPRLSPKRTLGDYELLEKLGRGGMGVVWKARQVSLNRTVALKMIRAGEMATLDQVQRFRTEATTIADLDHPHIVPIYEVGEQQGEHYFSMKLIEGSSLTKKIDRFTQNQRGTAKLLATVARAVHHAHRHGILHRDLKPGNILLEGNCETRFDPVPYVTDFGLAKRVESDDGLTQSDAIVGTPSYMAPEQARGEKRLTTAVDIYALGVILYELLTGHKPFRSSTPMEALRRVIDEEPKRPQSLNSRVNRDLETICMKCLEKDPHGRYSSAEALAEDLERWLSGEPIRARRASAWERVIKWAKRRPAAAALLAVGTVAGLSVFLLGAYLIEVKNRAKVQEERQQGALRLRESELALQNERLEAAGEITAIGEFATNPQPGWTHNVLKSVERVASLKAAEADRGRLRTIAAGALGSVDLRKVAGLAEGWSASCLAFSPDGKRLAIGKYKGVPTFWIDLIDVESRQRTNRLFLPGIAAMGNTGVRELAFSPESRWLVAGTRGGKMYAWDLSAPDPTRSMLALQPHQESVYGLAFRADGKRLVSCSKDKTLRLWDTSTWKPLGSHSFDGPLDNLAFAADGGLVACSVYSHNGLQLLSASSMEDGGSQPQILSSELRGPHGCVCLSPCGRFLATCHGGGIVLLEIEGARLAEGHRTFQDPSLQAAHEKGVRHLEFSRDGSLLVSGSEDGRVKIWEVATGRLLATLVAGDTTRYPGFSPDGRYLATTADDQTELYEVSGLKVQTALGQQARSVRTFAFSPDGSSVACLAEDRTVASDPLRRVELTTWDFRQGRLRNKQLLSVRSGSSGALLRVAYHPDGRMLACSFPHLDLWDLVVMKPLKTTEWTDTYSLTFADNGGSLLGILNPYRPSSPGKVVSLRLPDLNVLQQWTNAVSDLINNRSAMLCLSAGSHWAVAGSADESTKLFGLPNLQKLAEWPSLGGPVQCVALSADEAIAVSGTQKGVVQVVKIPSGEVVQTLTKHQDSVEAVAFSPDGQMLATGSKDHTIRLWQRDGDSFHELLALHFQGPLVAVQFSPDGKQLGVIVHNERAIRVWHLNQLRFSLAKMELGW